MHGIYIHGISTHKNFHWQSSADQTINPAGPVDKCSPTKHNWIKTPFCRWTWRTWNLHSWDIKYSKFALTASHVPIYAPTGRSADQKYLPAKPGLPKVLFYRVRWPKCLGARNLHSWGIKICNRDKPHTNICTHTETCGPKIVTCQVQPAQNTLLQLQLDQADTKFTLLGHQILKICTHCKPHANICTHTETCGLKIFTRQAWPTQSTLL